MRSDTIVELEGVNGEWATLAGPDAGDQGIWLAPGVTGIYDAPIKVVYEEPGTYPGARFLSGRILRRDIVFAVEILNDAHYSGESSWLSRDSFWRKMWSFSQDCKLYVTTKESGTRYLKLRLGQAPEIDVTTDPKLNQANMAKMTCISGDPFWYEDDVVYSAVTKKDTRFTPSNLLQSLETFSLPNETLQITVDPSDGKGGLNPTDQEIWLKWTVPASQQPAPTGIVAGIEQVLDISTAPFTQFTIPDYSFANDANANRRLQSPGLIYGEDCVVDTDPRVEQWTAANGAPVWARTGGVRFVNPVPPWTEKQTFQIGVSGCAPGQMITLRLPRPWSRPWGLE